MKKSKQHKRNKHVQFKRAPGNFMLEPKLVLTEIRINVIKGVCPWVRTHPGNPAICGGRKKKPKELYVPKEQQQIIAYANTIRGRGQVSSQAGLRT